MLLDLTDYEFLELFRHLKILKLHIFILKVDNNLLKQPLSVTLTLKLYLLGTLTRGRPTVCFLSK